MAKKFLTDWEEVAWGTQRLRVKFGWIYAKYTYEGSPVGMVFVPDEPLDYDPTPPGEEVKPLDDEIPF